MVAGIRELARQQTPKAIQTLVAVMERGKNESARIAAATALLDRGWGRPQQAVEVPPPAPLQRYITIGAPGDAAADVES